MKLCINVFIDYVRFCKTYELFRQAHLCDFGIFFGGRVASGSRQSSCPFRKRSLQIKHIFTCY